mgnify:CR=1 FL=1
MTIRILSTNKLWADALNISLNAFGESNNVCFTALDDGIENKLKKLKSQCILIIDSGIPGLDYCSFVDWLKQNFLGKIIVFTDSRSFKLQHTQLMQQGCHAVINKSQGFEACLAAINSFRNNDNYFLHKAVSPFDSLSKGERVFVKDLLAYDVKDMMRMAGVTQQAINKKKQKILKKLQLKTVHQDLPLDLLVKLYGK